MAVAPPSYCFVAFPPRAKDGLVVFGKNSARPRDEVQEVVYFSAADHEPESKVEVSPVLRSLGLSLALLCLWLCPAHCLRLLTGQNCAVGSFDSGSQVDVFTALETGSHGEYHVRCCGPCFVL